MTKTEKRKFCRDLIATCQKTILEKVKNTPEDWNGHELRRYIADYFDAQATWPSEGKTPYSQRRQAYRNTILIHGL